MIQLGSILEESFPHTHLSTIRFSLRIHCCTDQIIHVNGILICSHIYLLCVECTIIDKHVVDILNKTTSSLEFLLQTINKNQWEVYSCLEIQVNCFCVGIFHESEELVLVFMPYYFCFDYIMFNVQILHFVLFLQYKIYLHFENSYCTVTSKCNINLQIANKFTTAWTEVLYLFYYMTDYCVFYIFLLLFVNFLNGQVKHTFFKTPCENSYFSAIWILYNEVKQVIALLLIWYFGAIHILLHSDLLQSVSIRNKNGLSMLMLLRSGLDWNNKVLLNQRG